MLKIKLVILFLTTKMFDKVVKSYLIVWDIIFKMFFKFPLRLVESPSNIFKIYLGIWIQFN
jgi:hypothetical protein